MRPKNTDLDLNELRNLLNYNPETGILSWRIDRNVIKAGEPIGSLHHSGYLVFKFKKRQYLVHRIIWFGMTGKWPDDQIDHIDTIKTNNKWNNLREASHTENQRNKNINKANNTSGYKGVTWHKKRQKWRADIKVNGKSLTIGSFDNILDAVKAREEAGKRFHKNFNRT